MKLIGSGRSMSGLESVLRTQIRYCAKSEKVPPIAAIPEGGRLSEPLAHRCRIYTEKAAGYAGGSPLRTAFRRYRGRSSLAPQLASRTDVSSISCPSRTRSVALAPRDDHQSDEDR